MGKLPDNIIDLNIIKINRNINKRCTCKGRTYTVDSTNRTIYCSQCMAQIDPYDVLYDLAMRNEEVIKETKELLEQRKQIANYKPHLVVFKSLESSYRGKKMLPVCPNCSKAFYFEEICQWTNRRIEELRREKQKQKEEQVLEGQTKLEW